MTDRPIIFSAPMVWALLDGRKTQTRRVIKGVKLFSPEYDQRWNPHVLRPGGSMPHEWTWWEGPAHGPSMYHWQRLPWRERDRLWVREAHAISANPDRPPFYREGHEEAQAAGPRVDVKWRPSIHMPRWASRLTLHITDVRVERLQDISEDDAQAEGLKSSPGGWWSGAEGQAGTTPCAAFALLWNSLHGPGAWGTNPWVAAITFAVERANIGMARQVAA